MSVKVEAADQTIERFRDILKKEVQTQGSSIEGMCIEDIIKGYFKKTLKVKRELYFKQLLRDYKILKELINRKQWSKKDAMFVDSLSRNYNIDVRYSFQKNLKQSKSLEVYESFFEYCLKGVEKSRKQIGLSSFTADQTDVLSQHQNFEKLLTYEGDPGYRRSESFWLKNSKDLLCTQATSWARSKKQFNYLDIYKCFRRQNTDKTHSCEFFQLEYNKEYPSNVEPLERLIYDICVVLRNFDIDLSKIQIRRTRYTYVDQAIEVFYRLQGQMLQLAGGGIMKEQCIKDDTETYNPSNYYGAFGIGLQRVYMIKTGKKTLNQVYKVTKCDYD